MRSIFSSNSIILLARSPNPPLAFWGRLARVVFPFACFGGPVVVGVLGARMFGTRTYQIVGMGYLTLLLLAGLIALAAGRTAAKMSDEQRAGVLPESLLAAGRTSKGYWENQAVLGALFAAASIFGIALIVVGEL